MAEGEGAKGPARAATAARAGAGALRSEASCSLLSVRSRQSRPAGAPAAPLRSPRAPQPLLRRPGRNSGECALRLGHEHHIPRGRPRRGYPPRQARPAVPRPRPRRPTRRCDADVPAAGLLRAREQVCGAVRAGAAGSRRTRPRAGTAACLAPTAHAARAQLQRRSLPVLAAARRPPCTRWRSARSCRRWRCKRPTVRVCAAETATLGPGRGRSRGRGLLGRAGLTFSLCAPAFTACAFSGDAKLLATLTAEPDNQIAMWKWGGEKVRRCLSRRR